MIKRNRGNGGQGIWKVELTGTGDGGHAVRVLEARRGSTPETIALGEFLAQCAPYFADGAIVVDQPFQPRLPEGMIRCYMASDRVVGYGHQLVKALVEPPPDGPHSQAAQPGPRIMHPASAGPFQALRREMEGDWTPAMMGLLGIDAASLPIIWDADFFFGPSDASGADTYVLCEINVSSVFAIPDDAPAAIAQLALTRSATRNRVGQA